MYPNKKWALFIETPNTRKVIENPDDSIHTQQHEESLSNYIKQKHGLSTGKKNNVNLEALESYMKSKPILQRANMAKLHHRWIPTNAHLHRQNRHHTDVCPHCNTCPETSEHILKCSQHHSITSRTEQLYNTLTKLKEHSTSPSILHVMEEKLSTLLNIPSSNLYGMTTNHPEVLKAMKHQNIIG
jgi:hypothetical protein